MALNSYFGRQNYMQKQLAQPSQGGYGSTYSGNDPMKYQIGLFQSAQDWLNKNPNIWGPYKGDMVAGPTDMQNQARTSLSNFLGGNPFQYTQQGAEVAGGVAHYQPQNVTSGSFLSGDIGAYMNPYQQQVVDVALGDIDRSRQIANQSGARSAGASTYGGDRNALIEAETNRGYADAAARTSAQLRSQGFDTAASLMGQDMNRNMTAQLANQGAGLQGQGLNLAAANALGGFGSQMFNQNLMGSSALNQFGTQDQANNQMRLDRRYNEWMRSQMGPMQGFNFLGGLLGGMPYDVGQNKGAGFAGGALSGASIGAMFGVPGALIGGGLGGLLGLF